jgi:hypothetical protein
MMGPLIIYQLYYMLHGSENLPETIDILTFVV